MGTDCRIVLSPACRVHDVAKVIGILLGAKATRDKLACNVPDVSVEAIQGGSLPECCRIIVQAKEFRRYLYHFECEYAPGSRLIMPCSTAENIALGRRLVDFFGGWVDYQDCDDVERDYETPFRDDIAPSDNEPRQAFQDQMYALQPLTAAEIEAAKEWAAYD